MKPAITLIVLLSFAPAAGSASGWNDYTLEIAPGFEIVRANTFQIGLATSDGWILVAPELLSDDPLGPMVAYAVTPDFIFTHHHGARPDRDNPPLREADPSRSFFFRVSRSDSSVTGPIPGAIWEAEHSDVESTLEWHEPENPNFWLPLLGSLMFLCLSLPFIAYQAWPVVLSLAVVLCALAYWRRRDVAA